MKEIRFYYEEEPYGYFSNFYPSTFELDGESWNTVEHYYQAQKSVGTKFEKIVRMAENPDKAKHLGNSEECPLREDWETVKIDIMRKALKAKYMQNSELKNKLLSTGNSVLIENSKKDFFWGIGADESGLNMLGKILMEIRKELYEAEK